MTYKMKRLLLLIAILAIFQTITAGNKDENKLQPKLVVGIVIDQMRYDYLYRFYDQYSENGFKRLMNEGMNFTYAQYNYIPTFTGPGHACIYTGTTPYYHGIIANDWYDKKLKKKIYCVKDAGYKTVGASNANGQMSPNNLLATTMTDQLRLSNNGLSRVFAISIKDRAAVLPGGHTANAAYWYDGKSGNFITSSYYMKELPGWVDHFNEQKLPAILMSKDWQLESDKNYETSLPDNGPGEGDPFKEGKTTFPHQFTKLPDTVKRELIRDTPYGNDLLADFLLALLKNEKPGSGKYCDFVAVSFSSTDYVGHAYGPNSMEIMDTYLKLDKQIARILDTLDLCVGKGNYLLFLTADHGVKPNTAYLISHGLNDGYVKIRSIRDQLVEFCTTQYNAPRIIEAVQDNEVYLNHALLDSLKLNPDEVTGELVSFMRNKISSIGLVLPREELLSRIPERTMNSFILNGFNIARSGDISFTLTQNYISSDYGEEGTSHESAYDYDTHVPLIFYGWNIRHGESNEEVFVEDIAPTISNLIHIQEPDATIGVPIVK